MAALAPYHADHVDWRPDAARGPLPFPIWSNEVVGEDTGDDPPFESFVSWTDDPTDTRREFEFEVFLATIPMMKPTTKRVYVVGIAAGAGDTQRVMDALPGHVEEVLFASSWNDIETLVLTDPADPADPADPTDPTDPAEPGPVTPPESEQWTVVV